MPLTRRRLLGALAILAAGVAAHADERLRVDVDEANPPFMAAHEGRAVGLYPALLRAVFAEMGVELPIEPRPWRRALAEIGNGEAGVGGIYKNSERAARFDYSAPLFTERIRVFVATARAFDYKSLADLHGKRVGVISGWSYGDEFDAARRSAALQVEEVPNDGQNFRKLAAGRIDAMLAIDEAARSYLALHPDVRLAGTLAENPTYLAFNKSAQMGAFLERFNAALAHLKATGAYERIVARELQP